MAGNYRVFSKYRLLARLGSGGMAEVFLAVTGNPGGFSKLQVLKVLRTDLAEQERLDFARMFHDEARLAARLSHPNIVQSHEVGSEDGHDFIAMEFLEGQPLSHIQERAWEGGGDFSLEMQLQVFCFVLEGLEYAHTLTDYDGRLLHIVHRDVSPQNVFITYAGHTKLVDFGIAKTLESNKTRAGVVKGKVPYMSPEQVLGGPIDHRADLFSVGVMLWEAIACRHMHGTASVYEILRSLVQGDLPSLRAAAPDVPAELEAIVTRALSLKPENRFADAREFRDALLGFLETRPKVSTRELGERMSSLFAEERREINEVIRQAMTEATEEEFASGQINAVHLLPTLRFLAAKASSSPSTSPITAPTATPSLTPPGMAAFGSLSPVAAIQNGSAPPVDLSRPSSPEPEPKKRWPKAAVALGVVAAAFILVFLFRSSAPPSRASSAASSAPAPSAPVVTPPANVGAGSMNANSIRVRVHAIPADASLVLDGTPLSGNPVDSEHPRDSAVHMLVVSAPGHDSRTLRVRFNRDVDLEVRLAQAEQPDDAARSPQRAAPTAKLPTTAPRSRAAPAKGASDDLYKDLPARKGSGPTAPPLDTSESPW
jgi:serine/threonine protein kinase